MKTKKSGTSHASVTVAPSRALSHSLVPPSHQVDPFPKKLILSAEEASDEAVSFDSAALRSGRRPSSGRREEAMAKSKRNGVDRRNFLKSAAGAAAGAAALAVNPAAAGAAAIAGSAAANGAAEANAVPSARAAEAATIPAAQSATAAIMPMAAEVAPPQHGRAHRGPQRLRLHGGRAEVDGFEYLFANPGSSFRGLHESVINYGGNKAPEFITCCHEESATAMAHGYSKIEGKPGLVFAHGTVGLQHATMGIYNAYCDRAPVYVIVGNTIDATMRRPGVEWDHSVQDAAAIVREFVKWDDLPISLPHFSESAMRAYQIATTPPMMPVVIVADSELQERPMRMAKRCAFRG